MTRSGSAIPRTDFHHLPVMPDEVVENLRPSPGDTAIDATVGGGGHAALILDAIGPSGKLIGIDRDGDALAGAAEKLGAKESVVELVHGRMGDLENIIAGLGIESADCILADLGVSSFQFDEGRRGFSIRNEGPLDMRMDAGAGATARELIRESSPEELERIFREYGEERYSGRIARRVAGRDIETTSMLAREIEASVPGRSRGGRIHPATRVFQALRIAVNDELGELASFVRTAPGLLAPGGRLVVISYHSLEDRMVKHSFRELAAGEGFSLPHRKAVRPAEEETERNPRARSSRLRTLVREGR